MRKFSVTLAGLVLGLVAGCGGDEYYHTAPDDSRAMWKWSTLQSPETGLCYEVVTRKFGTGRSVYTYSGMSEIPCDKMK